MASLNLSKFWTTPLQLVPNRREDRDASTWSEPRLLATPDDVPQLQLLSC